jgi:2-keto-4-pentenoate hydratase/2-oxohepta-3-ene-1,7-dioic acid hydratase in catechol pathway
MLHPSLDRDRRAIVGYLAAAAERLREVYSRLETDADIELVHRFRVELRRIRTALKALGGALPVVDAMELADECRWLAGRSGGLRDMDVFLERLEDYARVPGDDPALGMLRRLAARRRSRERRALLSSCRSQRAQRLLARLQMFAQLSPHAPGWPVQALGRRTVRRALRSVLKRGRAIDTAAEPQALHDLRKRCKRLRYLLEMYSASSDEAVTSAAIRRLRKLQNVLGDYQDFATHARMLEDLSGHPGAASDQALGTLTDKLLKELEQRGADARDRFARRFAQFSRGKHHRRLRALLAPEPGLQRPLVGSAGYCHGYAGEVRIDLPIGKLVCVGRNYAAHAQELGNPVPATPLLFIKPPTAAVDFAPFIRVPTTRGSVHHELEIALLIGRELCAATPEQARAGIAGIGLAIDLTLRDVQETLKASSHPWELAKGFDGACPLSAFLPLDPMLDLSSLELRLVVNGRRRQFGNSAQMLTPIIELICHASTQFSLWPGDVVLTGTPRGVGPLVPGDRISADLAGTLRVRSQIVA